MKRFLTLLYLLSALLFSSGCSSGGSFQAPETAPAKLNSQPSVAFVNVSGIDGTVTLGFKVEDADNDTCSVNIQVSSDGGKNYLPLTDYEGRTSEIVSASQITIKWKMFEGRAVGMNDLRFRITAHDGKVISQVRESNPFSTKIPSNTSVSGKFAFMALENGINQIFMVNADGSNLTRISDRRYEEGYPALSLDGTKLAFVSNRRGYGSDEIYILNLSDNKLINITKDRFIVPSLPSFSPDGKKIVFTAFKKRSDDWDELMKQWNESKHDLFIADVDGSSEPSQITDDGSASARGIFLADGSKIHYRLYVTDSIFQDYLMNIDGSGRAKITGPESSPTFSPDGQKMYYSSNEAGNYDIYSSGSDGSGKVKFISTPEDDSGLCLSPEGLHFAFRSGNYNDDIMDLFIAEIDGSAPRRITFRNTYMRMLSWGRGYVMVAPPDRTLEKLRIDSPKVSTGEIDLSKFNCVAVYSDYSEQKINPVWSVISGAGSISNNEYIASLTERSVTLRASYTESGVTRFEDLAIALAGNKSTGEKVVFSNIQFYQGGGAQFYSMNPDGSGLTQLTFSKVSFMYNISFSRDGKTAAFMGVNPLNSKFGIYLLDTATKEYVNVIDGCEINSTPCISSDGKKIVFSYQNELYTISSDGTGLKRITKNSFGDGLPFFSNDGSKIIFSSKRGQYYDIFTIGADGSGEINITNNKSFSDDSPCFSPDGKNIAYISWRDGRSEIYIMDADGKNPRRMTDSSYQKTRPLFSPDSKSLTFAITNENKKSVVCVHDIMAGITKKITLENYDQKYPCFSPDGLSVISDRYSNFYSTRLSDGFIAYYLMVGALSMFPSVSSDGKLIVFSSDREFFDYYDPALNPSNAVNFNKTQIFVMNADGSGIKKIGGVDGAYNSSPSFSSDGQKIVFLSSVDKKKYDIYVMNLYGGGMLNLTAGPYNNGSAFFSSDGKKIIYSATIDEWAKIFIMNADGSDKKMIAGGDYNLNWPMFSPDGKKIAFLSNQDGNTEIYTMNLDGSGQTRITRTSLNEGPMCFSPDSSKILFTVFDDRSGSETYSAYVVNIDGTGMYFVATGVITPFWWGGRLK